jgi:hypothetical protein
LPQQPNQALFLQKLIGGGLSQRVLMALSVLQGTNSTSFYTAADIAFAMVDRSYPNILLTPEDFRSLTNQIVNRLVQSMVAKGNRLNRANDRQSAGEEVHRYYSNSKTAYGYRIGVCLVPLINADMAAESKILKQAVVDVQRNPLPHAKELAEMLSHAELSELISHAIHLKDRMYFEKVQTESSLRQRLRVSEPS